MLSIDFSWHSKLLSNLDLLLRSDKLSRAISRLFSCPLFTLTFALCGIRWRFLTNMNLDEVVVLQFTHLDGRDAEWRLGIRWYWNIKRHVIPAAIKLFMPLEIMDMELRVVCLLIMAVYMPELGLLGLIFFLFCISSWFHADKCQGDFVETAFAKIDIVQGQDSLSLQRLTGDKLLTGELDCKLVWGWLSWNLLPFVPHGRN